MNRVVLLSCFACLAAPALNGCFNPTDASASAGTDASTGNETAPSTGGGSTGTAMTTATATMTSGVPTTTEPGDSSSGDPPMACEGDADCDDGLMCNGEESCDEGVCADGSSPCTNPDEDHCVVTCDEGEDSPVCGVEAADSDMDNEGSADCAEAPGLDCDDDNDQVNSTAEEVCDGLDNDCNGAADTDDGLPLYGSASITPQAHLADLAYSPDDEVYGIAYNVLGGSPSFTSYDLDQNQVASPSIFPDDAEDRVFLEWSGETFVAIYRSATFIRRQGVTPEGFSGNSLVITTSGAAGFVYGASELVTGGVIAAWEQGDDVTQARVVGPDLNFAGQVVTLADAERRAPRFARVDNVIAAVWQEDGATDLVLHNVDLEAQTTIELTDDPTGAIYGTADVANMGDGFVVTYGTGTASQRVEYAEYESDGTLRCGPLTLTSPGQTTYQSMDSDGSMAGVYVTEGDAWNLYRVREGCEVVGEATQIENVTFFGEIGDVDVNASGFGIVTQIFDDGGANPRMSFRALGPNLCDAPIPG